jgi:hypothetical protein
MILSRSVRLVRAITQCNPRNDLYIRQARLRPELQSALPPTQISAIPGVISARR